MEAPSFVRLITYMNGFLIAFFFLRLLQISSFNGKMNALNEVRVGIL